MKIKPKDLGCFEQVAKVIGKKQAKIELKKVLNTKDHCSDGGFYDITSRDLDWAFYWKNTTQGNSFWNSIDDGNVPEALKDIISSKEEHTPSTQDDTPSLKFIYINYKGDVGTREVINPAMEYLVDDKYHGTGWCIRAFDVDKGKERVYSVKDVVKWL